MAEVAIVTGGGRGIGSATCLALAGAGYHVAINYRSDSAAATALAGKIQQDGGRALPIRGDVGNEADIERLFAEVDAKLGPVRALVNNAGISGGPPRMAMDMRADAVNHLLAVNVTGTIICVREAARRMSTRRGGSGGAIVNVSSVAARLGAPKLWVDYAASKGAIDSLTIGLASELAEDGIRVNSVRPGLIDTEIHATAGMPDRVARTARHLPMKRAGTAEEVAAAIIWLLSSSASYVTGAILDVAGGR